MKKSNILQSRLLSPLLALVLALMMYSPFSAAVAQDYPRQTVTLIVPVPVGSGADLVARLVSKSLEPQLGQSVVIRNLDGGNAIIGANAVARANPDGYTLLMTAGGQAILPSTESKLPFDVIKDFLPVALLTSGPILLVANANFPANSIQEMVAYAKRTPKKVTFGDPGIGTVPTLATLVLSASAGIDLLAVGYRGGAPALMDVAAGTIDMYFSAVSAVVPLIQARKVKVLGISSAKVPDFIKAIPELANVRPVAEQGYPNFDIGLTYGIFAPANTPRNVIVRLETALGTVMRSAEIQKALSSRGIEARYLNSTDYARHFKSEMDLWANVVKSQTNLRK